MSSAKNLIIRVKVMDYFEFSSLGLTEKDFSSKRKCYPNGLSTLQD